MGRPSNMPQAQAIIARLGKEAQSSNRIYMASIHDDLCEADLLRYTTANVATAASSSQHDFFIDTFLALSIVFYG